MVFAPSAAQMYPQEQLITVDPGPMGQVLEGASRPGFFTGVLTVVLKLFQLVQRRRWRCSGRRTPSSWP